MLPPRTGDAGVLSHEFLGLVVPAGAITYIVEKATDPTGRILWKHYPVRGPDAAKVKIQGALSRQNDVYFATAAYQQGFVPQPNGKPRPSREITNIHSLRSFWLDIDVWHAGKDPAKSYPDIPAALGGLQQFLTTTKLPHPQIIVQSGNGVHIYWVTDEVLPYDDWHVAAVGLASAAQMHGLKADYNVTKTGTAILRVPDTWNYKVRKQPLPVLVLGSRTDLTAGAAFRGQLKQWAGPVAPLRAATPLTGGPNDALRAGLDRPPPKPRRESKLLEGCGVIRLMHQQGAKVLRHDTWRDMISIVALLDDGDDLAHEISKDHPHYRDDDSFTKHLEDARAKDRPARCSQFTLHFPTICQACPNFGRVTSPIETAVDHSIAKPEAQWLPAGGTRGVFMPPGFTVNEIGELCYHFTDADGKDSLRPLLKGMIVAFDVFERLRGGAEAAEIERLIEVKFLPSGGRRIVKIQFPPMPPTGAKQAKVAHWAAYNLSIDTHVLDKWEEYYMTSYREILQQAMQQDGALRRVEDPYGWTSDRKAFAVSRQVYREDGTVGETAAEDVIEEHYTPRGEARFWADAGQYVLDQLSPQLQMLVASSFGAPLVEMLGGGRSLLMNFRSKNTGTGKSTAMVIAATVWGHPLHGMMSVSDTENAAFKKVGTLRHLPLFWDELRSTQKQSTDMIFRITQGRERTRMTAQQGLREGGAWCTLLACASNDSMLDRAQHFFPSTEAGIARVFEVAVPALGARRTDAPKLDKAVSTCGQNYGHAGREYVKYLVTHRAEVAQHVHDIGNRLLTSVPQAEQQRFWLGCATVILAGAYYATKAGVLKFDMAKIMSGIEGALQGLRGELDIAVNTHETPDDRAQHMANFVNKFLTEHRQQLIKTDKYYLQGRPMAVRPLIVPVQNKAPLAHVAIDPPICLLDVMALRKFAFAQQVPWATIRMDWVPAMGGRWERRTLGQATNFSRGQGEVLVLPLTHPDLQSYAEELTQPTLVGSLHPVNSPGSS